MAGIEGSCADKEICAKEESYIEEGIGARDVTCVEKGNCTEGICCRVKWYHKCRITSESDREIVVAEVELSW